MSTAEHSQKHTNEHTLVTETWLTLLHPTEDVTCIDFSASYLSVHFFATGRAVAISNCKTPSTLPLPLQPAFKSWRDTSRSCSRVICLSDNGHCVLLLLLGRLLDGFSGSACLPALLLATTSYPL
eukprot:TRINITY_DN7035_c0_g2_i1.p1 TRINITY_DN7035_c0_g2~~TRINITY_DN7035_c0_g2_i1.p1  ORF type:complete len:125 (+),score=16.25 TRINITY_DN7035_c0_g2_i1:206-580(+)